jgi:hypothetical protein
VSAALAAVVETAAAKDPERRYPTMAEMLRDLEAALEVEVSRAGRSTGEVTTVLDSVPPRRRRILTRRRISWAGILLVLAAAAAAVAIVAFTGEDGQRVADDGGGEPVQLASAADFDPDGDETEVSDQVDFAIDGDPTGTAWVTEQYDSEDFGGLKDGVGLVLDAGRPVAAEDVEIRSAEGGWDLEVYAAEGGPPTDLAGWGTSIGGKADVEPKDTVPVNPTGKAQYYLLWMTKLAQSTDDTSRFRVEISDVKLIG